MLPARAFRWTPLGAFMLRERVGDSSLKGRQGRPSKRSPDPAVTAGAQERLGSPQILEELGSEQGDLH